MSRHGKRYILEAMAATETAIGEIDQGVADALDELYATLPSIKCRGLCARSCGPLLTSRAEAERCGASFIDVPDSQYPNTVAWPPKDRKLRCQMLKNGRCTVYASRPALCRLWGVAEEMPCQWGCVPERMLTRAEGTEFLARVAAISQATTVSW